VHLLLDRVLPCFRSVRGVVRPLHQRCFGARKGRDSIVKTQYVTGLYDVCQVRGRQTQAECEGFELTALFTETLYQVVVRHRNHGPAKSVPSSSIVLSSFHLPDQGAVMLLLVLR
jgi:hypothetical protein